MKLTRIVAMAAASCLTVTTAACGANGHAETDDSGNALVTVALPFASCLAWWPFHAAESRGFYDEAKVSPTFEGLDGSSAAIQAALSGQADVAVSAPDNYLSAAGEGAEVEGWFSFYQTQAFFLVTPSDSGVTSPEDLKGKTVGISTPGGGDVTYARSLLTMAGLDKGDFKELAVGDGGSAGVALKKDAIDAYSASYFDQEIIEAGGVELQSLADPNYPEVVGQLLVSTKEWNDANSEVIDGFGRAVGRGIDWGLQNRDEVVDMCADVAPDETQDREFARVIVDRVAELVTPPGSVNGQYGVIDVDAWNQYRDLLVDLKIVPAAASEVGVDNSHVEAWNK